jgi:hypothetical protein
MPHYSWGVVGRGLLRLGVRVALRFRLGWTSRLCSRITRSTRFLLIARYSTKCTYAQILRYPQNGCSALSAWMWASRQASRSVTWADLRRVSPAARRCFLAPR